MRAPDWLEAAGFLLIFSEFSPFRVRQSALAKPDIPHISRRACLTAGAGFSRRTRPFARPSRTPLFLPRATAPRALPAIGSVRNVNEVAELVDSGEIHWLEIEEPRIESD